MILLILDIIILSIDVVITVIVGSPKPNWVLLLHETFLYVILVILGAFVLEIGALLLVFGWRFFLHFMYILDLVVVVSAFVLEIIFGTLLPEFLMLLRIWRFLRIGEFGQCIVNDILKVCAYVMEEHEAHIQTKLKMERDLQRVKKELNDLKNVDQIDENSPQDGVAKEKDATPKNQEDAAKGQEDSAKDSAETTPNDGTAVVEPKTDKQSDENKHVSIDQNTVVDLSQPAVQLAPPQKGMHHYRTDSGFQITVCDTVLENPEQQKEKLKQKIAEAKPPENWVTPPTEAQNGKADTSLIEKEKELKNVI